jgi:hypothetical protein
MKRKKRPQPDPPWTPFQEVEPIPQDPEKLAAAYGCSVEEVKRVLDGDVREYVAMYQNSLYTVLLYKPKEVEGWPAMWWLSIRRNDRKAIHDWRHFQRIKNELVGPEHEAIELYPAESRLVDTSNQYHLWVLRDPKINFPFGFDERAVIDHNPKAEAMAPARQRPLDPHSESSGPTRNRV